MATGRPSKFKTSYIGRLADHMREGLSFESFAAEIGVHRGTLYEWVKAHPEFSDAKKRGEAASLLYWEKIGIQGMLGEIDKFNVTAWIYSMKCRFPGWRQDKSSPEKTAGNSDQVGVTSDVKHLPERRDTITILREALDRNYPPIPGRPPATTNLELIEDALARSALAKGRVQD